MSIQDEKMVKAIRYIQTYDTQNIYALGLRCCAWRQCIKRNPKGGFKKYLHYDAVRLIN